MSISRRETNVDVGPALPESALYAQEGQGSYFIPRTLLQRRRFLGKAALVGFVVSLLISLLFPNEYRSSVQLMPPQQGRAPGLAGLLALASSATGGGPGGGKDVGGGLSSMVGDALGFEGKGAVFVGILRSRTVADDLVNRFDLRRVYRERTYEQARKQLAENTTIIEDKKNGIITVTVVDRDRKRAAELAGAYVNELDKLSASLNTSAARREREFLEERLKGVKQELDQAARELGAFSSKNSTIDVVEQGKAMVGAAAALQGQLIAAESQLQGLQAIYTPNNVRVRATQARVAELKKKLGEFAGQPGNANVDGSTPVSDLQIPSIRQLPVLGVQWADRYRRTKVAETVFQSLTMQYELAKVQEAKEIPSVRVLDAPQLAERRSGPHRFAITLFGTLLFLFMAGVWVAAEAAWHRVDPGDHRKAFAGEVLDTLKSSSQAIFARRPQFLRRGWKRRDGQ